MEPETADFLDGDSDLVDYPLQYAAPRTGALIGLRGTVGVTTGPVTVPLVLALGIGIASAAGSGNQSLSGFGIVTLASLFPIMGVQLLALYIHSTVSVAEIEALSHFMNKAPAFWYETTPYVEIIAGIRAIVPLVLFLGLVLVFLLRDRLQNAQVVMLGLAFSVVGMIIFNLGLTYGLAKLGGQAGEMIPGAFYRY